MTRKFAAVPFYLELAGYSSAELPEHSFPAVFDLADGERRFPDKGLIKTLIEHGLATASTIRGELIFTLTEAGRNTFLRDSA